MLSTCFRVCVLACLRALCVCVCACVGVCVCMCVRVCVRACTCMYTFMIVYYMHLHSGNRGKIDKIPWVSDRITRIDELLADGSLECPKEWTQPYPVFGTQSNGCPKIAEGLWHLADAGLYVLLQTQIDGRYLRLFVHATRVLSKLLHKASFGRDDNNAQLNPDSLQKLIARALGELECALPIYWSTNAKHQVVHGPHKIGWHGFFHEINMLREEGMHIFIRKLASNQRHTMSSIAVNYAIHDSVQHWRLQHRNDAPDELALASLDSALPVYTQPPLRSTFAGARQLPPVEGVPVAGRERRGGRYQLSPGLYLQLLQVWAVQDRTFENMMARWESYRNPRRIVGSRPPADPLSFSDYFNQSRQRRGLTNGQRKRATVANAITELRSFELDTYYFTRYQPELKTDNSCVLAEYVSAETGQLTIAYGRIQLIFEHELYEGGPKAIFIDCKWYETVGVEPITGLTRIRRNRNFDSARLCRADHVLPVNCAFWKEDPFNSACDTFLVILQRDRDPTQLLQQRAHPIR